MEFSRLYRTMMFLPALILLAGCFTGLAAQVDIEHVSMDAGMLDSYMAAESEELSREAWDRISSREKIERERRTLLREFRFMIGLDPLPPRTDLEATVVRTIDKGEYTIEVLHFQSLPGFYVTADLYRPKKGRGPFPAVIWGPGHSSHPYGSKALRQYHAIPWVRNGYVCMIVDPIQVAEVLGVHRGTSARELYGWYSRGYTPIGMEVWNAMRAADYLIGRPDVDGERLIVNGVSGGGHLSWMAGAADPRLAVVQPVAGTADVETHVKEHLERMHCDCAYFINTFRHDWPTLAALVSPRPLLMHNSIDDAYYPPVGYEAVLAKAKKIFGFYGVPEETDMFEVPGPHGYYPEQRARAIEWSNRWLRDGQPVPPEEPFDTVPGEQLAALGGQLAEHPPNINDRIQDLLIPRWQPERFMDRGAWELHRSEVMERLRSVVLRNMPKQVSWTRKAVGENGTYVIETEPGVSVGMQSYVPGGGAKKLPALLYVASQGDPAGKQMWEFCQMYPFEDDLVSRHLVYPRGTGVETWNTMQRRKYERTAMVLGRTMDDMRLYDVLCAVDRVAGDPSYDSGGITVAGKGSMGLVAAYAALLDERITRVVLYKPPFTHDEGPVFLNVLRYTDVPQSLAMLAPRELVVIGDQLDRLGMVRGIYGLYRAHDKLRRAATLAEAVMGR